MKEFSSFRKAIIPAQLANDAHHLSVKLLNQFDVTGTHDSEVDRNCLAELLIELKDVHARLHEAWKRS